MRHRPPPQLFPEWQRADDEEQRRQENRDEADRRPDPAVRRRAHHRAEIGGEGEQRSGHGLRGAVTGEKRVVVDPTRRHDGGLQQRQNHVPAAEHQRTRAIERIEFLERLRGNRRGQQRQADQQREEHREQQRAERAAHVERQGGGRDLFAAAQEDRANDAAERDRADLPPRRRRAERDDGRDHRERGARAIGCERARHAEHRLRHDRDRRHLEAVQPAGAGGIAERADAVAEQHHRDGRWQRESDPGRQGSGIAAAQQADGETHLARGRPGQELAERDQVGVALVVEPAPPVHELLAEIAEMRDRSAEGGQSEPEKRGQDFTPASAGTRTCCSGFLARRHPRLGRLRAYSGELGSARAANSHNEKPHRRPNSRSISLSLSST